MKIRISLSSKGPFEYALVNRPAGPGCCPKDFIGVEERPKSNQDHYDMARHGSVVYDRELTDAETKNFELAFMADGKARRDISMTVANKLRRYAEGYCEMHDEELPNFVQQVQSTLKKVSTGFVPSVGDMTAFAELVYGDLKT